MIINYTQIMKGTNYRYHTDVIPNIITNNSDLECNIIRVLESEARFSDDPMDHNLLHEG
jgi:hypothetical protein